MKSLLSNVGSRLWPALAAITVLVSSLPAQAEGLSETTPPGFRDGEWVASFSMHTSMQTGVTNIKSSYKGQMGLISSGGEVNGEWTLSGTGNYSGDITGIAYFDGAGKVGGAATEPQISTSSFVVDMALDVAGMKTSQQVDLGSGAGMPLTLVSSTCSQVIADIQAPTNTAIGQAGMSGYSSGSFAAVRVDDLHGANAVDYQKQLGDLLDEAEALKQKAVEEAGIDFATLNTVVSKAENLQTALRKNLECAQPGNKQFITSITGIIFDLADFALGKPELFTTGELNRLAMAALSVGAMGSGAVDPQSGAELLSKFTQEFTDRLGDAQASKDCMEATQIKLAGLALNNPALKQQADLVVTAVC